MWNKLFKSKSKSSKNLSNTGSSSSNGSTSTAPVVVVASPPLDLVPIYNYETDIDFRRNNNGNGNNRDEHNRDSIGVQMCGIPMRKSKFSNAFKSLSLRRGSSKNQLKLYPGAGDIPIGDDEIEISTASKRASLRPSKSDNNLNEKQNYTDQEKDDAVFSEQYIQQPVVDPFLVIPEPPQNLELQQCPICTRNFVPTSLAKHIGICEKMQSKKRKPFDSSRQRREGTELASYLPKNFGLPQNHPQARVSPPKTTNPVRKLSTSKTPTPQRKDYGDNGINHLMSSSLTLSSTTSPVGTGPNAAMAANLSSTTPRPILKRSLSQQNEPCPYCERCFGFKAFDRHVEWCREKALLTKNANNNNSISAAKERLQARIQYKAPQIRSKRALNREKYSGSLSCGGSTNSLADLDLPLPRHRSHLNSMSSSISSDNGFTPDRYDPFLSAKRQLEELFSPSASTPRQQQNNSQSTTPLTTPTSNCMSKSVVTPTTKTSPVINSNFRRASSLRMPRKVSRPMFIEKAKSNIQKGITDDGPVSPNFLKSSEYDEIPIKSAFNALQMAEKPKMRDSSMTRKNLKLDIKDPNMPATDVPLSKTDSLAVFLKYEHELNLAAMSEKDMKDKSNSLSKRSLSLGGHERKESMLYGGVTGNGLKSDRSPQDEKDKAEKILQDIQPFKKLPQKLIPIKLEPINITYSNNSSCQKTINNVNNSSKSNNITKNNNNNNINSSNIGTSKPALISLDVILGKKPKPPPPPAPKEEKDNRKDPNYIDPKLINKCDNLPMTVTKLSSSESECSAASTIEIANKPTDSNRLAESANSSPENSSGETGGVGDEGPQPILDNKLSNDSTKDDSYDTRPTLTRQNGTGSCSSTSNNSRASSREESPVEQQLRSPLARNQSHLEDTKPQTPDSGLERSTPKPSTPIPVQKKPERPPLPSFDDFDFDQFISSFEDERRSFKNALYARSTNSNCNTISSSSTNFIQHTNSSSPLDNSVKSVTSLNGSVSCTSSPSHFNSSNSPHYNSLKNNGRSEETPTVAHQQPKEPPQVPRRRHIGELVQTPSHSTIRNLPSLPGSIVTKPAAPTPTDPRSPKAFGPTNDNINNNSSPLPRETPSSSRLGSGNSFNHHHPPYQQQHHHQQQQQQQPSTANHTNNNTISAHLVPQPYTATTTNSAGSPLFDYHGNSRHQSPLSNANHGSNGNGVGGPAGGGGGGNGGGGIIFDDLSPTERDLMKSVQELDRMCESSSSMYPADSDEMSSVEGYPLSNSSRDHGTSARHHHRSERPSAEGSKFSADSAYGSLSRQSPPEQHHTIRRAYGHHRGGSKSTNVPPSQQDAFDNSSGSESSLPPITATLKTQKVELHAHKVSPAAAATSLQMSKFCHECGSRFMIDTAKFCMECGIRRIMLD